MIVSEPSFFLFLFFVFQENIIGSHMYREAITQSGGPGDSYTFARTIGISCKALRSRRVPG